MAHLSTLKILLFRVQFCIGDEISIAHKQALYDRTHE